MQSELIPENLMPQLSELVTDRLGIHFPTNRWSDLQRGLDEARKDLGLTTLFEFAHLLIAGDATKDQLDVIASRLTVGETYFYREPANLEFLQRTIIPELVQARRKEKRLRIWSAACCTGEEAYTIAILLQRTIPNLADWQVSILATDVNPLFLKKAAAGVYGQWSFRTSPGWLQRNYFREDRSGKFEIDSKIKSSVTFAQLNLVEDSFPSLPLGTNAFDIILCRNVLMYFSNSQIQKVVGKLEQALVSDGWLIVSATEASVKLFPGLLSEPDDVVGCYRKAPAANRVKNFQAVRLSPPVLADIVDWESPQSPAPLLQTSKNIAESPDCGLIARTKANEGALTDAREWSERWIKADKLNGAAYYLNAVILQELGDVTKARRQLQRAIYLDPGFVLAHFSLGLLARDLDRNLEATRHFNNALQLLQAYGAEETLPESDGLTAARLQEMIRSIAKVEVTA